MLLISFYDLVGQWTLINHTISSFHDEMVILNIVLES